ncbi:hypothetical protein [Imhoffiella purpurea]|uniref:Uncharacterized protein n=1 Tax=Imhoffiella purpurea TaxID=1249627 RepID=W9V3J8_9GAMM|nr:hypothetical protein [Imhoffiella purpurea]EXJ13884.1 hypothetical protein D779_3247 [Imhoffiella purpurea]
MSERTYTTSNQGGRVLPFPTRGAELENARIKKITITDEGKLAIALECELADEETLEHVRNLLLAQRGPVSVEFASKQGELDL